MSRRVGLTRKQRELLQTISKRPKPVENLKHLSSSLSVLQQKKAVAVEAGMAKLTEIGRQAIEAGYL